MSFRFICTSCHEIHEGVPTFCADAPLHYRLLPENEREQRAILGTDHCIVDGARFFVCGCLQIPVQGEPEPFTWGVWVDLSESDYRTLFAAFGQDRSGLAPVSGYLGNALPTYPDTRNLEVFVQARDGGRRPLVQVSPTQHPLFQEQRSGISHERMADICEHVMHRATRDVQAFAPAADGQMAAAPRRLRRRALAAGQAAVTRIATVVYDAARNHHDTIRHFGLPEEHAYHPATFFLSWLVKNGMMSNEFEAEEKKLVNNVRLGLASINELYKWCGCCLVSDMLNPEGNAFAQAYFDSDKGMYFRDYLKHLKNNLPSAFHVQYTPANETIIHAIIDERYREWKKGKQWWQFWT